jgi:hypothetical protein
MKYEVIKTVGGEPAIYKILNLGENFRAAQHETKQELVLPLQAVLENIPEDCRIMLVRPQQEHKGVSLLKKAIAVLLKE